MEIFERIFYLFDKNSKKKQSELARILNVANSTVSEWRQKRRNPPAEHILAIADFFDVTTDYLLGRDDDGYPIDYVFTQPKPKPVRPSVNRSTTEYKAQNTQNSQKTVTVINRQDNNLGRETSNKHLLSAFARFIKNKRIERPYTQAQFASAVGVDLEIIHKVENDLIDPSDVLICKLADALNLRPQLLIDIYNGDYVPTDKTKNIARNLENVNPKYLDRVEDFIKDLLNREE